MRSHIGILLLAVLPICAAERLTATGSVTDESKAPIENATVMVYSAGVRTGYDQFCPTCYVDCGKRATTDANGNFSISGLSPDLLFTLLVVREGFSATFVRKHDPAKGPAIAALKKRAPIADPKQAVLGKVVDKNGNPVRDALVSQQGAIFEMGRAFGDNNWIDLIAVSNRDGEFELAYNKPIAGAVVEVAPRAMAPTLATLQTGTQRQTVTVTDGSTLRGRLVSSGKPVPNAELVLTTHSRASGTTFKEVRIGTNAKGEFAFTNVPPGRVWDVLPRMDSLAPKGLAAPVTYAATKDDGHEVNVGDIAARPAFTVRGRVVLADGTPIPAGMRISLTSERGTDRQLLDLPPDGAYEFKGVGPGIFTLMPAVKGYAARNADYGIEFLVEGNIENFNVTLHPAKR